ncbi:ABC transporter ATP-binding protein [Amycolatopsis pithecellobii]|uniref:ATP-binding cassette domain-containing protein n=1 Tax=Amycolatopsis pithecellobii TaxID=664692 RepID=A0A6N7Z421_9PSEU|nr:ABC transporter ATP-binding protein [Amycolatopsis pithecellobii]MTD54964.1 ATP-binding cassette domain-containing protein [Amycolatopsis pithecellobii]
MLEVTDLWVSYGGIAAVRGVDLTVAKGSLVALIGSNGAGKSTTLNTIAGLTKSRKGTVTFHGENVTGRPAHRLVRAGLALVPEGRMVAAPLTVAENLRQAGYSKRLSTSDFAREYERVLSLFPVLGKRSAQIAGSLSGGEQQMLALGRALLTGPDLLLLDEPSMGLAPVMVDTVFDAIRAIHAGGMTILLVEQNAELATEVCDEAVVLQRGEVLVRGRGRDVLEDETLRAAFLA